MAFQLYYPWEKNPRLLHLNFYDRINADDLYQAFSQAEALMEQSTVQLHLVIDFNTADKLPDNMLNLLLDHSAFQHDHCGYCVFVEANEFVGFVAKILQKQRGISIEFALDLADAWEFFNQLGIC